MINLFAKILARLRKPNNKTFKQKIGKIGEDAVVKHLKKEGFKILDRNYWKKWGEIDIVAEKDRIVHFIEVKSISYSNYDQDMAQNIQNVSRKTLDEYRAEDNMHHWKTKRLRRVIETYIMEKGFMEDRDWQCDLATVLVDMSNKTTRVSLTEDIIF